MNILQSVPLFLEKLLINIDNRSSAAIKSSEHNVGQFRDVSRKSQEQLGRFLEEFRNSEARNVQLDKKILNQLLSFLLKDTKDKLSSSQTLPQENSKIEALFWLRDFIRFFQDDFLQWQQALPREEEKKEPAEQQQFLEKIFQKQFPKII